MYVCTFVTVLPTLQQVWILEISGKNFPRNFIFRGGRCNVRNTDWLIVAMDETESAGEETLVGAIRKHWETLITIKLGKGGFRYKLGGATLRKDLQIGKSGSKKET